MATSINELWQLMSGGEGVPPVYVAKRADSVPRLALAGTRARIQLAWAPWTDLATGLRSLDRA